MAGIGYQEPAESFSTLSTPQVDIGQSISRGAQIADSLQMAQLRQQEIKTQQQQNAISMMDHTMKGMGDLAIMDPSDPRWKVQFQYHVGNLRKLGVNMDQDTENAYAASLKSDDQRNKITSAIAQLNDPNVTPALRAQAMVDLEPYASSIDKVAKIGDSFQDSVTKAKMAGQKMTQYYDTKVKGLADAAKQIDQKFADKGMATDELDKFINGEGKYKTGIADLAINDLLTRALTNTVVRQFTLNAAKQMVPVDEKGQNWLTQTFSNGKYLGPKQLSDYKMVAQVLKQGFEQAKDREMLPYYAQFQDLSRNATANGKQIPPESFVDPEVFNRLQTKASRYKYNPNTQSFDFGDDASNPRTGAATTPSRAKPKKEESFDVKSLGYDDASVNAINQAAQMGWGLDQINGELTKIGRKPLTAGQYGRLKKSKGVK